MKLFFIPMLTVCFLFSVTSAAQQKGTAFVEPYAMPHTQVRFLTSKINGIAYKLYISHPKNYYGAIAKRYPVLYVLDADYSFAIAKNIVDHLSERNHLQELIIVGIAYAGPLKYRLDRTRDYTPTNSKENVWFRDIQEKYSGGAPQFSAFIESELIPFVDGEYRTTAFRAITGHSYGGLFSSWTLLTKPDLFSGYIIVSPSLWYDDKLIFGKVAEITKPKNQTKVYFSVGDREINSQWNMPLDLSQFVRLLQATKSKTMEIKHEVGKNETHNSIFPSALSNGIRFVFDGV